MSAKKFLQVIALLVLAQSRVAFAQQSLNPEQVVDRLITERIRHDGTFLSLDPELVARVKKNPEVYTSIIESRLDLPARPKDLPAEASNERSLRFADWSSIRLLNLVERQDATRMATELFVSAVRSQRRARTIVDADDPVNLESLHQYSGYMNMVMISSINVLMECKSDVLLDYSLLVFESLPDISVQDELVKYYNEIGAVDAMLSLCETKNLYKDIENHIVQSLQQRELTESDKVRLQKIMSAKEK